MESKLNNKKEFSDRIIKVISKGDLEFLNEYGIQKDILQKILQQSISLEAESVNDCYDIVHKIRERNQYNIKNNTPVLGFLQLKSEDELVVIFDLESFIKLIIRTVIAIGKLKNSDNKFKLLIVIGNILYNMFNTFVGFVPRELIKIYMIIYFFIEFKFVSEERLFSLLLNYYNINNFEVDEVKIKKYITELLHYKLARKLNGEIGLNKMFRLKKIR